MQKKQTMTGEKMKFQFKTEDLVRPNSFVRVKTHDYTSEGLKHGDIVYIVQMQALPTSSRDPYKQEVVALCHPLDKKGYLRVDDDAKLIYVKPKKLRPISEEDNARYVEMFNEQSEEILRDKST